MKLFCKALLLWAILVAAPGVSALGIVNPYFSAVPVGCGGGYAYQVFEVGCGSIPPQQDFNSAPGMGWTFNTPAANGLTTAGTAFYPPSFSGLPFTQAVFLQDNHGAVWQSIAGFEAGATYALSFYLGSRYLSTGSDGNQTVEALLDSDLIGSWSLNSFSPFALESAVFTSSTSGARTLKFRGTVAGDHTAFLSGVTIVATAVPEPAAFVLFVCGLAVLGWTCRKHLIT